MDAARAKQVEAKALDILQRHYGLTAPVDVVHIASKLGIRVLTTSFRTENNYAGMIQRKGASGTIWVNRFDAWVRQRFTIAHELGHWMLHLTKDGTWAESAAQIAYRPQTPQSTEQEQEANRFAAALLMPSPLVNAYLEQEIDDPAVLADIFDVSRQAMDIRIDTLREFSSTSLVAHARS